MRKEEWKMENLKYEFPKPPSAYEDMVRNCVQKCVEEDVIPEKGVKTTGKLIYAKAGRTAAVLAAAVLGVGMAVYAADKLYGLKIEKEGTYAVSVDMEREDVQEELPEQIKETAVDASYLPENMQWYKDGAAIRTAKNREKNNPSYLYFEVLLAKGEDGQKLRHVENAETIQIDGEKEAVYINEASIRSSDAMQTIYIPFFEDDRVVEVRAYGEISKEELIKTAESVQLKYTGNMVSTSDIGVFGHTDRGRALEKPDEPSSAYQASVSDVSVHQAGEPVMYETAAYSATEPVSVSMQVDNVRVYDDLSAVTWDDPTVQTWRQTADENGKLNDNERLYIKRGNGKETKDTVVEKKEVPRKLVAADVTITNQSGKALDHVLYFMTMDFLRQNDGMYQKIDNENRFDTDRSYDVTSSLYRSGGEEFSADVSDSDTHGGNYIPHMEAGESVHMQIAWIVDEDMLPYMYIDVDKDGGVLLSDENRDTTLTFIDVRQNKQ